MSKHRRASPDRAATCRRRESLSEPTPGRAEGQVRGAGLYLPGHQLQSVFLEGLHFVQPGRDDLLQLLEGVRLEGHPGQTLETPEHQDPETRT